MPADLRASLDEFKGESVGARKPHAPLVASNRQPGISGRTDTCRAAPVATDEDTTHIGALIHRGIRHRSGGYAV